MDQVITSMGNLVVGLFSMLILGGVALAVGGIIYGVGFYILPSLGIRAWKDWKTKKMPAAELYEMLTNPTYVAPTANALGAGVDDAQTLSLSNDDEALGQPLGAIRVKRTVAN